MEINSKNLLIKLLFPIDNIVTDILANVHGICKFQQHVKLKQEQVVFSSRGVSPGDPVLRPSTALQA